MLSTVPPKSHLPQPSPLRLQTRALWLGRSPPDPADDKLTEPCLWSRKTTLDRCYQGQLEAARRSKACGQPAMSLGCHQRPHSLHKGCLASPDAQPRSPLFCPHPQHLPHPSRGKLSAPGVVLGPASWRTLRGPWAWAGVAPCPGDTREALPFWPRDPSGSSYPELPEPSLRRGCSHLHPPTPRPPCRVSPEGCAQCQASAACSGQGAAREPRSHAEHTAVGLGIRKAALRAPRQGGNSRLPRPLGCPLSRPRAPGWFLHASEGSAE